MQFVFLQASLWCSRCSQMPLLHPFCSAVSLCGCTVSSQQQGALAWQDTPLWFWYVIVLYGQRVKTLYIVLSLCVVWGLSILLCIQYQVPQLYAVSYVAGAVCLPVPDDTIIREAQLFFMIVGLTIISLVPVVVCLVVPCIVLRYIKKHSITAESDYNKPVAKLALCLVTGTSINSVGIITISILAYLSIGSTAGIYSIYIIGLVSLYPAPILIIAFLKPVRYRMKTLLSGRMCNVCHDRYPMLL